MPARGPSTVDPAAICEGHSLPAPTSWRRHGNSKQQSHPLEVTPRVPGPTNLSLASPQSPDPIFCPQVPRPTRSHSLNPPNSQGGWTFKQNKKASRGKMWHRPFRAGPLTPPRQPPPESPFAHPPFEGEHGHCPPRGQSGLWGIRGGWTEPQMPGWGERQAQSSQRGLHCWIHSGCSLPIRWGLWGWLAPCMVPVLNLDGPSASWAAWGPGDLDTSPSRDPPGPRRGRRKSQ